MWILNLCQSWISLIYLCSFTLLVWDIRTKSELFSIKELDDYISSIKGKEDSNIIAYTSGEGVVTAVNFNTKKLDCQVSIWNHSSLSPIPPGDYLNFICDKLSFAHGYQCVILLL